MQQSAGTGISGRVPPLWDGTHSFLFDPAQTFENQEGQARQDRNDCSKPHAFQLDRSQHHGSSGQAGNECDRSQDEILWLGIIDFAFHHHAQARRGNEAEEQDADAAHDGARDVMDESRNLAHEREDDGQHGCAADDPGAVDTGDCHDSHVFSIRRVRSGPRKAGQDIGNPVCDEGAVQARIPDEVTAHDITRHEQMAQMFCQDNKKGRHDHHDCIQVEARPVEGRCREPAGCSHGGKGNDSHGVGNHIPAHDADEDRDDADETLAQDGGQDGDDECCQRDLYGLRIRHALDRIYETGHIHGHRSKFQTDDGYDGSHCGRREEYINPAGPDLADQQPDQDKAQAKSDEASLGIAVCQARCLAHCDDRRNESKTGPQIRRQPPFADRQIDQRTDPVHEERRRRVDIEQERHEHGGTKHGKQVLQTEGQCFQ